MATGGDGARQPMLTQEDRLGVGIYGFGRIGRVHALNVAKSTGLRLDYVVDVATMRETVEGGLPEHCATFVPLEDDLVMLNDKGVSLVILCNPTAAHVATILRCLEHGKHVLCEKPISLDVDEIRTCYDAAAKHNLQLLCAFNRRFDEKIRALHAQSKEHEQCGGNIHRASVVSRDHPYPEKRFLRISGGVFHDCAVHDIDVLNWIMGAPPTSVQATGTYVMPPEVSGADADPLCLDNALITLNWASGAVATICSSRISRSYDQRIEVFGDKFDFAVTNAVNPFAPELNGGLDGSVTSKDQAPDPVTFQKRYSDSYVVELDHMERVVRGAEPILVSKHDALAACTVADACGEAFRTGQPVAINVVM